MTVFRTSEPGRFKSATSKTQSVEFTSIGVANPMADVGDIIYGGAAGAPTKLAGNTTVTAKALVQTGDGVNSAAPVWTQQSISALAAPTGDVAWGTNKITGVKDPTNAQDAATKAYADTLVHTAFYVADGGAKNAYTATLSPAIAAYAAGLLVAVTITAATNDAATTLALNGLAAKPVVTKANAALSGGELTQNSTYLLVYDGTSFRILA